MEARVEVIIGGMSKLVKGRVNKNYSSSSMKRLKRVSMTNRII